MFSEVDSGFLDPMSRAIKLQRKRGNSWEKIRSRCESPMSESIVDVLREEEEEKRLRKDPFLLLEGVRPIVNKLRERDINYGDIAHHLQMLLRAMEEDEHLRRREISFERGEPQTYELEEEG